MNHQEAIRLQAAERYVLGELEPEQREAFEQHYFECAECTADLRQAVGFVSAAREHFRSEALVPQAVAPVAAKNRWAIQLDRWLGEFTRPTSWAPALAAVVLLTLTGYQRFVVISGLEDRLQQTESSRAEVMVPLRAAARGTEQAVVIPKSAPSFTVFIDNTSETVEQYFTCEVREFSETGTGPLVESISRLDSSKQSFSILLNARKFHPGLFVLTLRRPDGRELNHYRFEFQIKDSIPSDTR